jgi:hypothetical protein
MDMFEALEIINATVNVADDGRTAVLSLWTSTANPRAIQATMSRHLLERLVLVGGQELEQKPKPARGQS